MQMLHGLLSISNKAGAFIVFDKAKKGFQRFKLQIVYSTKFRTDGHGITVVVAVRCAYA
jgi:hypothetical protein